jgi:hypothetical protein
LAAYIDTDASLNIYPDLGIGLHTFRIAAPSAPQRTPLEEDLGPDTGPVVDGKSLNVEHIPLDGGIAALSWATFFATWLHEKILESV